MPSKPGKLLLLLVLVIAEKVEVAKPLPAMVVHKQASKQGPSYISRIAASAC